MKKKSTTSVKKATGKNAPVKTAVKPDKLPKSGKVTKPPKVTKPAKPPAFALRKSVIHGRGAFATRDIRKGKKLVEYTGELITWEEAERRYPVDPIPYHTFLFEIGDGSHCLDAARRGTPAKWFNHCCKPNCEAEEDEDERVFLRAKRAIKEGEELTYDYNLTCEEKMKKSERLRRYPCWCGVKKCRGTMLAKK